VKLKIGVVGLGIGRMHVLALKRLKSRYDLVAVVEPSASRARQARLARIKVVPDLEALLEVGVDVVDICTPPHLHECQTITALDAGCDVICEKPLVHSVAAVDRLAEAEQRSGRRIAPVFQYRWGDGVQKLRRLIDAGIAGKLYVATGETMWKREQRYYDPEWRGTWQGEGGGAILSHAIHLHDLLCWLGGEPAEVVGRTATRKLDIEVEDTAAAVITTTDGALMTAAVTLGAEKESSRLKLAFEHLTVESSQSPYKPGAGPWRFHYRDKATQRDAKAVLEGWRPPPSLWRGQFADTHTALTTGTPLPVSLVDARRSLALVTAWYASARTGRPESLPLTSAHQGYLSLHPDGGNADA
jgi:predicted dehydrogenase